MRPGRYALLILTAFAFTTVNVAHAQRGERPAPGTTYSAPSDQGLLATQGERKHDRPVINTADGTTLPGSRTSVNGASVNSDPVVAANRNGQLYDKRNGQFIDGDTAADAMDRADAYSNPNGVTLREWNTGTGEAGVDWFGAENGRINVLGGGDDDPGRLSIDFGRVEGEGSASVVALDNGVAVEAELKGQATLIGISGEIEGQYGDDFNNVRGGANGQAYIGADGELSGTARVTTDGIVANGKAEVFVGGKAEGEVGGGFTLCGVAVDAKASGEVSYGIGAGAEGYFKVDWSTMTVKIGGKAAATFGGGAGAGGEVEISLNELMKDPSMAASCAFEKIKAAGEFVLREGGELVDAAVELGAAGVEQLGRAADAVENAVSDGASWAGDRLSDAGNALCFWCDDDPPAPAAPVAISQNGYNGSRNANTVPSAAHVPTPSGPGGPSSSGQAGYGGGQTR